MSIHEIVFFTHSSNALCQHIEKFIDQYNVPAKKIPVESKNIVRRIKKGKYFSIRCVPTIIVLLKDGNIQRYEGNNCMEWLKMLIEQNNNQEDENQNEEIIEDSENEDEEYDNSGGGTKSMIADNGKLNIEEVTKRAEKERSEMEEMSNRKRKKM